MTAPTVDPVARLLDRTTRASNVPMVPADPATLARVAAVLRLTGSSDAK